MASRLSWMSALRRLVGAPLAVTPDEANRLLGVVRARIGDLDAADDAPAAQVRPRDPGYDVIDGVALVSVHGPLVHRLGSIRPWCGMTGYDGVSAAVSAAALDPNVEAILLDIDSPGGEVAGCFSVAVPALQRARTLKPLRAIAADCACSAAYAIAAQCERLYLPETAVVGSIGVITMHADISAMLADEGVAVTLITAGAKKADASSYAPLSDDARGDIQAEIDRIYDVFLDLVAAGRPGLGRDAARATEAGVLMGASAVSAGLADEILNPEDVIAAMRADLAPQQPRIALMSTPNMYRAGLAQVADEPDEDVAAPKTEDEDEDGAPPADAVGAAEDGAPDDEDAPPAAEDGGDEDDDEGEAATKAAERKRIAAILNHPEAKGRGGLAKHFAFETGMSPEAAAAALKAASKAQSAGGLAAGMAAVQPVGAGAPAQSGGMAAHMKAKAAARKGA